MDIHNNNMKKKKKKKKKRKKKHIIVFCYVKSNLQLSVQNKCNGVRSKIFPSEVESNIKWKYWK